MSKTTVIYKPSSKSYSHWLKTNVSSFGIIIVPIFILVGIKTSWVMSAALILGAFLLGILLAFWFLKTARITITPTHLEYTRLFLTSRYERQHLKAALVEYKSIGLYSRSPTSLIIETNSPKRKKEFPQGFWSATDLESISEHINAKHVKVSDPLKAKGTAQAMPAAVVWANSHTVLFVLLITGVCVALIALTVVITALVQAN